MKEILSKILIDEIEAIPEHLNQLSDKDRLDKIIKLMPYILPKQKEIEITNDIDTRILPDYFRSK